MLIYCIDYIVCSPAVIKIPGKQGFFKISLFTVIFQDPRSVTSTKFHDSLLNDKYITFHGTMNRAK